MNGKGIVCFYYPGSGGKFVLNCLGISRHCVLQSCDFLQLTSDQKFQLLIERCQQTSVQSENFSLFKNWNDLSLGDFELYGTENISYVNYRNFDKRVVEVIERGKQFLTATAHSVDELEDKIGLFSKENIVVVFENYVNFFKHRSTCIGADVLWKQFSKPDWPAMPTTPKELFELPKDFLNEFMRDYHGLFLKLEIALGIRNCYKDLYYSSKHQTKKLVVWDCDWFFSEQKTVEGIKELYKVCGFDDFNQHYITQFYNSWINALKIEKQVDLSTK